LLSSSRFCASAFSRTVTIYKQAMGFACVAGALLGFLSTSASAFDFQDVAQRARRLADAPYKKAAADLPPELRILNYENYHQIRYKPERMLWCFVLFLFVVVFFFLGWFFVLLVWFFV